MTSKSKIMNTENKTVYTLTAIAQREYSLDNGWRGSDHAEKTSDEFSTENEARDFQDEFVNSLDIKPYEVYEIDLNKITYEIDEETGEVDDFATPEFETIETLALIDGSEDEGNNFQYVLTQEYGNYCIPKGRYHIDHARHKMTRNEWLLRIEPKSFRSNVENVFKDKDEVKSYLTGDGKNIITSVIELESEEI